MNSFSLLNALGNYQRDGKNFYNFCLNLDFEEEKINDECKKKLLELIYLLPKINNYLFTKLAILIINKKISFTCINQILGIIKIRLMDMKNFEIFNYFNLIFRLDASE